MVVLKPESAIRRADELIGIGKKQRALETLLEVITSRRHRTWTKMHEPLMEKFLDLCVDLKKSQVAKDGLYQYKAISQTVSVKSLEDVIKRYLQKGEQRCIEARQAATNAVVDIDDLEIIQTPESLLLSAVSGESQQDRTDRDMLAPWLKFLWESYKQCLDLLKNNKNVERIYQDVAQMCFGFCKTYNRRPEFRKLCDTIRTHFSQAQRYAQQPNSINIHSPDTQALHLETRLLQLETAISMEVWQEAYKAIEDVHTFTTISKKTPKPHQLAAYYEKVALVFWKAGSFVFHATTVLKLFVLHKEQKKNITYAELCRLSCKALLSILSISLPTPRTQIDEHLETEANINEKQKRLTGLLSLQQIPTRASLIRDMIKQGVLNFVYPELKNLYESLEVEFNPLKLSNKVEEGIRFVENLAQPEYSQYMSALRDVTVVRLLQQISQVYQTIELKRLIELAPPLDKHRLEKIIVNAARNGDVQVRLEHKSEALSFGTDLSISNAQSNGSDTSLTANSLQKMPNEQIRVQLTAMSRALYTSMDIINEKANKERNEKLRKEIVAIYERDAVNQRKEILKRREFIERYKEEKEKKSNEESKRKELAFRHEKAEIEKANQTQLEATQKQKAFEATLEREKQELRLTMQIAIDKLRESEIGARIIKHLGEEELYNYDPESLNSLHIDAVIRHMKEQKEKLKNQFKKVDYLIRAQHEAEIPLIEKYNEEEIRARREIQLAERDRAIERRERLTRMDGDKREFLQSIRGQRHEEFVQRMDAYEERLQAAREERLVQLRKEYIEKKKHEFRRQRAADKQRHEQEQKEKSQTQERREREERSAEERATNATRLRKLDEQAEIQRARDRAIEEKLQQSSQNTSTAPRRPAPPTHNDKDRTDGQSWKRNVRGNDDNEPPRADPKDIRRDPRPKVGDRRVDESWKAQGRSEQTNRDERRTFVSPTSSDRRTEGNFDRTDSWQTVEKKRPNPPRNENDRPRNEHDRPSQQRSGESSSSAGAWRSKTRAPEETRDNIRTGPVPAPSANRARADESNNWRKRENARLNSWRANGSDDENQE